MMLPSEAWISQSVGVVWVMVTSPCCTDAPSGPARAMAAGPTAIRPVSAETSAVSSKRSSERGCPSWLTRTSVAHDGGEVGFGIAGLGAIDVRQGVAVVEAQAQVVAHQQLHADAQRREILAALVDAAVAVLRIAQIAEALEDDVPVQEPVGRGLHQRERPVVAVLGV